MGVLNTSDYNLQDTETHSWRGGSSRLNWESSSFWLHAGNLFTQWFKHFVEKKEPTEISPILLILDTCYSYKKYPDVVGVARWNHVEILNIWTTTCNPSIMRAFYEGIKTPLQWIHFAACFMKTNAFLLMVLLVCLGRLIRKLQRGISPSNNEQPEEL